MGLKINRDDFNDDDYVRFAETLEAGLVALRELLDRPGFGAGDASLGAELELSLLDAEQRPSPVNLEVLGESIDDRLTFELDRFNLECNLRHGPLAGRPFDALANEIRDSLREVKRAASLHDADVVAIGILPTLREEDLQSAAMTDTPRFRALSRELQRRRGGPFELRIDGADPLETQCQDVTFEGAATSLQIHLRTDPPDFARLYNASQIASVASIAASGNSPIFLGHRLWQETRVALFKQAVDLRDESARRGGRESRVSFGTEWVRDGAFELFEESVRGHAPLLPVVTGEDALAELRGGRVPRLAEIRLHQGTVWRWNRPVFDPVAGGHLRIELRCLPAGPSVIDMAANAAYLIGLTHGLAAEDDAWRARWDFDALHGSFYRAAQHGLDAVLLWPKEAGATPREVPAAEVIERTLSLAEAGLTGAGVEPSEARQWLDVVARRVQRRQTGARWQLATLDDFEQHCDRNEALARMLGRYVELAESGAPGHEWPVGG